MSDAVPVPPGSAETASEAVFGPARHGRERDGDGAHAGRGEGLAGAAVGDGKLGGVGAADGDGEHAGGAHPGVADDERPRARLLAPDRRAGEGLGGGRDGDGARGDDVGGEGLGGGVGGACR